MSSISVVIPVYNADLSLENLYLKLIPAMEAITKSFEVIMVDDGSRDGSWEIIMQLFDRDSRVRGIRLSRNYGQHNAVLCGIRAASFDIIVTMDDDLQNPATEIHLMLDKLAEGYDVVYGVPQRVEHGLLRSLASKLTKMALKSAMGMETARNVSPFRAFRTKLREGFKNYNSPFVFIDVLLTWTTSNFASVKVRHEPRRAKQSNYTLSMLIRHAINLITGFSIIPLQIASLIGFIFTLFGFGILGWVLGRYFITGTSIPGFPFLASIIAIFSGAQLFTLGIFGEYLARIHFRTMDRPPYVVGQVIDKT
jgi:undecaprenyl-phosphate 4-deoxy-4-formamido-L-arabinose transferase